MSRRIRQTIGAALIGGAVALLSAGEPFWRSAGAVVCLVLAAHCFGEGGDQS